MIQLILGGARSGKSRLAQQIAIDAQCPVIYIATAQAQDAEMQARIAQHQQQRPSHWRLIEEPIELAGQLLAHDRADQVILVDCLTLWMSNLLLAADPALQRQQCEQLYAVLPTLKSQLILVSNETGLGVVPMGELTRRFVDESGWMHQQLAQQADEVRFCVAGLSMQLKGNSI